MPGTLGPSGSSLGQTWAHARLPGAIRADSGPLNPPPFPRPGPSREPISGGRPLNINGKLRAPLQPAE
eukprot:358103-Chlamydomonas_euryale.AAC.4